MSLPSHYRKVVITRFDKDFRAATDIQEVPMPEPAANEILVRNMFAGVNASDVNISAGVYFASEPPHDAGVEASGEVVAVGAEVDQIKVGDHVLTNMIGGGYREYQTVAADFAIPIAKASPEITSLPAAAIPASMGLDIAGEMRSGETVLVTAAAGGVGHFAVQLAKLAGNHVIATCGTPEKVAMLRDLGADRVIDYREEDVAQVLASEYSDGIDLVLEGVGQGLFDAAVANIATRGRIVVLGFVSEYKTEPQIITAPRIYHQLLWKSAMVRGFLYSDYVPQIGEHMAKLLGLMSEGKLRAITDPTEFVGIESVADAVEYLHSGANVGKVIVRF